MMKCLLVELLGIFAVVTSANCEARDSFVLAQWSYRVTPAVLASGPSDGDFPPLAASTAAPNAAKTDMDGLEDILRSLDELLNPTGRKVKSGRKPEGMMAFMQFFQAMCDAVRSDLFMSNMTKLYRTWVADQKDYGQKVQAAIARYTFLSRTANDNEMPPLTISVFNNVTNLTVEVKRRMKRAMEVAVVAIPHNMQETMNATFGKDDSSDSLLLTLLPSNLNQSQLCVEADFQFTQTRELSENMSTALKFLNASKRMMPMMKNYLEDHKPDVASRVMFLMEDYFKHIHIISSETLKVSEVILSDVKPVLSARMGCKFAVDAGVRHGLGILALLVAVIAWLEC